MGTSSITGGQRAPMEPRGRDAGALGPSDSSDSGSDVHGFGADRRIGDAGLDSDSDRSGTGERLGATPDTEFEGAADISPDEIQPGPDDDEKRDDNPEKG